MNKKTRIALMAVISLTWLFTVCLPARAEVTATIYTNKDKYILGEDISTFITLSVSDNVTTTAGFLHKKFEWNLDVRGPDKQKIQPTYYIEHPQVSGPPPPPPVIPTEVLAAGDYKVYLQHLGEHYDLSQIGQYTVRFVTSMSIYDPELTPTVIASNIDKFEIITRGIVALNIEPNTISLNAKTKWITAYISALPRGYGPEDIIIDTVELRHNDANVLAEWGDIQDNILMLKFDGASVQAMLSPGDAVELEIAGELTEAGIPFKGIDTIRVIEKGKKEKGKKESGR